MKESLLYGIHAVTEALRSGKQIEKIWISKNTQNERIQSLKVLAEEKKVPLQFVPQEKIATLTTTTHHQGIIAKVSEITYIPLETILIQIQQSGERALLLLLDGITDVRNIGAIIRTAECMGVHALILPVAGSGSLNADAARVSAGAVMHLPICRENHALDAVYLMQSYGIKMVACTEKARNSLYEHDFSGPVCLIFGSEEKGISPSVLKNTEAKINIPMKGKIESLNVSVSAGIVISEVVRQRHFQSK